MHMAILPPPIHSKTLRKVSFHFCTSPWSQVTPRCCHIGTMPNPTKHTKEGMRGPTKDGLENLQAHFEYIGYSKNDKSPTCLVSNEKGLIKK